MASWFGKPNVDVYGDNIYVKYLELDHAYVILDDTEQHFGVYSVNEDCYKCPYKRLERYDGFAVTIQPAVYRVSTAQQAKWRVLENNFDLYIQDDYKSGLLCEMKPTLGQFGVYRLDVGKCTMETEVPPVNIYLPLLLFCLIILTAGLAFGLIKLFLRKRHNEARSNDGLNLTAKRDNSDIMPSLHFLRGILLILLIFVLTGGGGYPVFSKSYGGLTVANCLLFAFTLTIGLKIPIMFDEESRIEMSKLSALGLIFLRSLTLLIVGVVISEMTFRSYYVATPLWAPLPCIALCYFVAAVIYMISTSRREIKPKNLTAVPGSLFWSWFLGGFLTIIMIVSTYVFYFTECKPYADFNPHRNEITNGNNCKEDGVFSEVFNKNMLSVNRDELFYVDYYYAFSKGLLGVISTILTALIGLKAGIIYLQHDDHSQRTKLWCFWAAMFGVAGVGLAVLSGPMNFNLWPIATIFLISSATLSVYILIYLLTEVHEISGSIIRLCGVASIATLTGHLLFSHNFPFYWGEWLNNHFIYLWQSTWVVCLWVLITVCVMKWRAHLMMIFDEGTRRVILAW